MKLAWGCINCGEEVLISVTSQPLGISTPKPANNCSTCNIPAQANFSWTLQARSLVLSNWKPKELKELYRKPAEFITNMIVPHFKKANGPKLQMTGSGNHPKLSVIGEAIS